LSNKKNVYRFYTISEFRINIVICSPAQWKINKYKKEKNTKYCDMIKRLSPVAWQHINLVGKYDFCKNQINVNFQEFVENLKGGFKKKIPLITPAIKLFSKFFGKLVALD